MVSWRGRQHTTLRFGSQAADERFVTSSQQRRRDQRASSFAEPADFLKPGAVLCVILNPVTLAVMWPKCRYQSGPPLPTCTAFPRCSMHRAAASFPLPVEAEFRLGEIQPRPGPETETVRGA